MIARLTPKRFLCAALVLGGLALLIWGVSSWRVGRLEVARAEAHERAVRFEAEAVGHRKRADALEQQMAARDKLIEAKDILIDANSRKAETINDAINKEEERFQAELAAGADLDADALRTRICERFNAAGISATAYCSGAR